MQVQKVNNQNFGMAVKYSPGEFAVKDYIKSKHSKSKVLKSENILRELSTLRALTSLNLEQNKKGVRFNAVVGDKIFRENFFNSPYRVLKKTLKESKEESKLELIADVLKILSKD